MPPKLKKIVKKSKMSKKPDFDNIVKECDGLNISINILKDKLDENLNILEKNIDKINCIGNYLKIYSRLCDKDKKLWDNLAGMTYIRENFPLDKNTKFFIKNFKMHRKDKVLHDIRHIDNEMSIGNVYLSSTFSDYDDGVDDYSLYCDFNGKEFGIDDYSPIKRMIHDYEILFDYNIIGDSYDDIKYEDDCYALSYNDKIPNETIDKANELLKNDYFDNFKVKDINFFKFIYVFMKTYENFFP